MAGFKQVICCLLIFVLIEDGFAHPTPKMENQKASSKPFHAFISKLRFPRAQGEEQSGSGGVGDLITTAIKDGIAASSALDSPTMFVGGFSVMMQPMPNGTEFAGQLMQMAPHYLNMLPALPGAGRKHERKGLIQDNSIFASELYHIQNEYTGLVPGRNSSTTRPTNYSMSCTTDSWYLAGLKLER